MIDKNTMKRYETTHRQKTDEEPERRILQTSYYDLDKFRQSTIILSIAIEWYTDQSHMRANLSTLKGPFRRLQNTKSLNKQLILERGNVCTAWIAQLWTQETLVVVKPTLKTIKKQNAFSCNQVLLISANKAKNKPMWQNLSRNHKRNDSLLSRKWVHDKLIQT